MSNLGMAVRFGIPAVLLLGVAWFMGGTKRKPASTARTEPPPFEDERPESDRMVFDDSCQDLMVRVQAAEYDLRITDAYWTLRQEGYDDPEEITAEILTMDAPQCTWPPVPDSSLRSKQIWDLIFPAVELYWNLEKDGQLDEFAPIFGTAEEFIT